MCILLAAELQSKHHEVTEELKELRDRRMAKENFMAIAENDNSNVSHKSETGFSFCGIGDQRQLHIHSFRPFSIAPLQVRYYSEALPTQHGIRILCRSFTPKRHR